MHTNWIFPYCVVLLLLSQYSKHYCHSSNRKILVMKSYIYGTALLSIRLKLILD